MDSNTIATVIVAAFVLLLTGPVTWLVREVIQMRKDLVEMRATNDQWKLGVEADLHARSEADDAIMKTLGRMDRNTVRLCENAGVQFEGVQ